MQIQWVSLGGAREKGEKYVEAIWYFVRTSEALFFSINPAISLHLCTNRKEIFLYLSLPKGEKKEGKKEWKQQGYSICPTGGEKQPDLIIKKKKKRNIKENKPNNKVGSLICWKNNYNTIGFVKKDLPPEVPGKWWRTCSKVKDLEGECINNSLCQVEWLIQCHSPGIRNINYKKRLHHTLLEKRKKMKEKNNKVEDWEDCCEEFLLASVKKIHTCRHSSLYAFSKISF